MSNQVSGSFAHEIVSIKDENIALKIDVKYKGYFDSNYGSDADGNRGITELVDLDLTISHSGKDVTDLLYNLLLPEQYEKIEERAAELAWEKYNVY